MKKSQLLLVSWCIAVLTSAMLIQCESPKKVKRENPDDSGNPDAWNTSIHENASEMLEKGKAVFRFETFGDEVFWTDKLQLHKAIADKGAGGIGEGLSPKAALDAGLKVDLDILPKVLKDKKISG